MFIHNLKLILYWSEEEGLIFLANILEDPKLSLYFKIIVISHDKWNQGKKGTRFGPAILKKIIC